jgi:hypothetical protein
MKLRIYDPRILVLDLRHRRFGYAVFEGNRSLLDWGVRVYPAVGEEETVLAVKRLDGLVGLFAPSTIVVKKERWEQLGAESGMHSVVKAVSILASSRSIPVQLVPHSDLLAAFAPLGGRTREEMAEVLTRIYPDLLWYLPPKRKIWQAEHSRMTVFDALALGLAYWQARDIEILDSEESNVR